MVDAWVNLAQVTSGQVLGLQVARAAQTFGDVIPCELQVQAAQASAVFAVDAEGRFNLAHDLLKVSGFGATRQGFGIAMHGVAQPEHVAA